MAGTAKFIGGITFGVSMDTRKLNRQIKSARKSISRFVKNVKNATLTVTGLSGAIGVIGFVKFAADAFVAIDSLAKVSDKIGVTTEALAGLRLAARETGAGAETLDKSLVILTKTTSEAAQGVGLGVRAFKMLGINAKELNRLSPDKQFMRIAEAVANLNNKQDQLAVTTQLLGTRGAALINTLRLGTKGLNEAATAADALGLSISRGSAKGVERAIDSFGRFKSAIGGIFRSIAIEIAPIIESLTGGLTDFLISGGNAKSVGKSIGQVIVKMAKVVSDGAQLAFAGLLRFVAAGMDLINNLRGSKFAQSHLGLSFPTQRDFDRAGNLRIQASKLERPRNLPSAAIDRLVAKAAAAVAAETVSKKIEAKTFNRLKGFLGNVFGKGSNAIKGIGQGASGIANLPIIKFLPTLISNLSKTVTGQKAASSGSGRGSLEFTQTGSAASFRQRAAIRRANEQQKLDIKRNKTLDDIKDQLVKSPVVLLPANL